MPGPLKPYINTIYYINAIMESAITEGNTVNTRELYIAAIILQAVKQVDWDPSYQVVDGLLSDVQV